MKLVVGGFANGKLDYVKETFILPSGGMICDEMSSWDELTSACVINHVHLIFRRLIKENKDCNDFMEELLRRNESVILIADEFGSGLVPMDAFERAYRDQAGHLLCEIAKQAEEVHRVVYGIGRVIKHA